MQKSIEIEVDQHSWVKPSTFPPKFTHGVTHHNLDVLSALLITGQLTTPPIASGATLSEFWAWVRYANAIADTSDLRITRPFHDLDSHQKTILSDDFGMGMPTAWLIPALNLVRWCDGRYFQERMSALLASTPPAPAKSGPGKSPDFVFEDTGGRFHVVECKGTQGTTKDREKQFNSTDTKGNPSGGCVQKTTIEIISALAGQRLVCGLVLEHEDGKGASSIKIVDPEGADFAAPEKQSPGIWKDPLVRATAAKALRGAGLLTSATVMAAPSGETATARPHEGRFSGRYEARRTELVARRRDAAIREIRMALGRSPLHVADTEIVGRALTFTFPVPLSVDGVEFRAATVHQGFRKDLLQQLLDEGFVDAPIVEQSPRLAERFHGLKAFDEGARGQLLIGDAFLADLSLEA